MVLYCCVSVTFGTEWSLRTFSLEVSTSSRNSWAPRGDIPVRKAKLLSNVAVALLLSAGVASAQGMSKDTPERAPAAQQNAPAEKVAPSVKSEQKAPQTTGQATPDAKSGKAKETTGQAPRSDADDKAQAPSRAMDNDKKSGAADGKSDSKSDSNPTSGHEASKMSRIAVRRNPLSRRPRKAARQPAREPPLVRRISRLNSAPRSRRSSTSIR